MQTKPRNVLIGAFVLAAIVLVVWLVLFLHPSVGDEGRILRVRFTNIEKVTVGSRVTFAGRPVGQVIAIHQIRDGRAQRANAMGQLYVYELVLAVDTSIKVYNTDQIFIHTAGLFGEKTIAIIPVEPPAGVKSKLITDQVVYAKSSDQMGDLIGQVSSVTEQVGIAFERLTDVLDQNREEINEAITAVRDAMEAMTETFEDVNQEGLVDALADASDRIGDFVSRLDKDIAELDETGFWDDLADLFENLSLASENTIQITDNLTEITNDLVEGKGTIGKLLKDEELYYRTVGLMGGGEELMDNLNNYGLLFQFSGEWKRKKRMRERYQTQQQGCYR